MTDEEYMKIAIQLSATAMFPFGAIVVDGDGKIVGRSDGVVKESGLRLYTHSEYRAIQDAVNLGFCGSRFGACMEGWKTARYTQVANPA